MAADSQRYRRLSHADRPLEQQVPARIQHRECKTELPFPSHNAVCALDAGDVAHRVILSISSTWSKGVHNLRLASVSLIMKKLGLTLLALTLLALMAGCGGLPAAETRAYLDSIPVGNLSALIATKAAGTYSGTYTIAMPAGAVAALRTMNVDVTVDAGHQVTAIALTSPKELDNDYFSSRIGGQVVAQQSLAVDGVSGASYSSKAYLKAIENALSK